MNIKIIFLILFNFIHFINSDNTGNLTNISNITNSSSSNSISLSSSVNNNPSNNSFVNIFPDELTTLNFEQQTKEDSLDAVSFGIKSFTVEVTTSSEKLSPRSSPSTLLQQVSTTNGVTTTSSTENPTQSTTVDDVTIKWPTTTTSTSRDNNGLYRVKIAEITTDEFDNHLLYNNDIVSDEEDDIKLRQKLKLKKQENHKFNIIDFYPSKIDDFPGVVVKQVVNEKKETTTPDLIPDIKIPTSNIEIELIEDNNGNVINLNKTVSTGSHYSNDFASELQEDDTIKKIEESFYPKAVNYRSIFTRPVSKPTTSTTPPTTPVSSVTKRPPPKYQFIERRVKKNDPQIKFKLKNNEGVANTKFTSDGKDKIEFSTTKFYSNNEQPPMQSSKFKITPEKQQTQATTTIASISPSITIVTTEMSPTTTTSTSSSSSSSSPTKLKLEKIIKISKIIRNGSEKFKLRKLQMKANSSSTITEQHNTITTTHPVSTTPLSTTRISEIIVATTTTSTTTTSTTIPPTIKSKTKMTTTPNGLVKFPLTIQKSIPPRQFINGGGIGVSINNGGITRLEEKVNSLDCELNNILPVDSNLWRGNETHELNLPITQPENCSFGVDCLPMIISWEGTIEIQSGDVLLVVIDDKLLLPSNTDNKSKSIEQNFHKTTTTVYQVTRMGHEHCDITEGVLLDITPLVVDGKKLVTLYDKDLTEGINLLIVVSELWKQQCVRLRVTVKSDNCGENAECSGKGVCFSNSSMEGYECQCCNGFAGSHCEEIDACTPSPCTNNGICVDLSQGHEGNSYQCLCPYGYTGKNCQYESEPCNPSQCLNSGTCIGNLTNFRCECAPGFKGPLCQHNLNECLSSPCFHGICVDQEDGFRCVCQAGYSGDLCNYEFNECESNPCLNGGQCNDHIGSYSCKCTKGYNGKRCHIKVDFCANDPCPEGHRCVDRGDDFTCECPGGRNGPDCNQVPRTLCNINPCANGGTCWTSEESFYCACRPGFTGKMCEDDFVVETIVGSNEIVNDESSIHTFGESSSFGSGSKRGPIELHNAYIAAGTLTAAIFIVAVIVTACHCKVNQTYRRFITRHHPLIPIPGFSFRKSSSNNHKHWLSGKGLQLNKKHLPATNHNLQPNQLNTGHLPSQTTSSGYLSSQTVNTNSIGYPVRTLNRTLPLNLENDMYYTVDFSDSQNAPLIQ